ncbi:MAG: phage holin family protein [Planctomycetota bacterium]|nr:phage holin family protein [Planctomycetota bacterium]
MSERARVETPSWAGELRRLFSDFVDLLALRRQLAELEVHNDLRQIKRLGIFGGLGLTQCLVGMAVLAVLVGSLIDQWIATSVVPISRPWGSLLLGAGFIVCGLETLRRSWNRFQRDFSGLKESIAELREDAAWLREWSVSESLKSNVADEAPAATS